MRSWFFLVGIITQDSLLQVLDTKQNLLDAVQTLQDQLKAQTNELRQVRKEVQQTHLGLERHDNSCKQEIRFISQIETEIDFQANVLAHVSNTSYKPPRRISFKLDIIVEKQVG